MNVLEQLAELFGETKYSISLFGKGRKLNAADKFSELCIGFTDES